MFAYIFVVIRYSNFLGRHVNRSQTKYTHSDIPQQVPISKNSTAPLKLYKCKKTSQQHSFCSCTQFYRPRTLYYTCLRLFVPCHYLTFILPKTFFFSSQIISIQGAPFYEYTTKEEKHTKRHFNRDSKLFLRFVERSTLCLYRPK